MKRIILPLLLLCLIIQSPSSIAQPTKKGSILVGVFNGRTPCQELAKQLNEPNIGDCIKIKWSLTLYKDSLNGNTGTYELEGFVFRRDNKIKGNWHNAKGTAADPDAIVYQLNQQGREPLFLQKGDDNVLFFLDKEKNLMVGNRDFSYALNRATVN